MTYATVCSGIEAPSVAWHPLGFDPVFFSEIEKFPSNVLAHHYPGVPNLGDMTKIDGTKYAGTIDLICGGTPCQSFSVAGLRKGMADPRGNLALVFLRLVDQIRPKWVVWENVPGVLSTNGGKDFGSFVGALGQLGYGWAMRILDAKYFGVPQRRRRVFVVAHLGNWSPAAAVLFERESLRWYFKPRKEAGEDAAKTIIGSIDSEGNGKLSGQPIGTLLKGSPTGGGSSVPAIVDFRNHTVSETCQTLTANGNGPSENNTPYVMATGQASAEILAGQSPALTCNHEAPIVFDNAQITSPQNGSKCEPGAPCPTIAKGSQQCVANGTTVRRITPKEAERLQGLPDNYTNIPGAKDGPRYKALGNSMAVPVMRWIGERIKLVNDIINQTDND